MTWIGSASEWKQGLSAFALEKVEELEKLNEKLKREKDQKQIHLDILQQAFDKQKLKTDEEVKQGQTWKKEVEYLERTCEVLQEKLNKANRDLGSNVAPSLCNAQAANNGIGGDSQKKIYELENENRILLGKINELNCKVPPSKLSTSGDDFWSHFSQPVSGSCLPQKSPSKTMIKTAIETSQENPFKAPLCTPYGKGLEVSEESPFRTPRKLPVANLPQPISAMNLDTNTQYPERKIEALTKEINELRSQPLIDASPSKSKCNVEICSLKTALENHKVKAESLEKLLASTNEQLRQFKTKAEEIASQFEKSENRVKFLQNDLECQRHNYETVKKRLEEKLAEKEKELNIETTESQTQLNALEKRIGELMLKLQHQETLVMSTENNCQASMDKVTSQLSEAIKEKTLAQSRCCQLETSVSQLEKAENDMKKLINQLKQEKELTSAQVETLKVKLTESETVLNRLQSQLVTTEQEMMQYKSSASDMAEKEKGFRQASADYENCIGELENQICHFKDAKEAALQKIQLTEEECQSKLAGVLELEKTVKDMENKLEESKSSFQKGESELLAQIEVMRTNKEQEIRNLNLSTDADLKSVKAHYEQLLKKLQDEKEKEIALMAFKFSELESEFTVAKSNEEKAKGDKLTLEMSLWELEGKLEDSQKEKQERIEGRLLMEEEQRIAKQELQEKIFGLEDEIIARNADLSTKEVEIEEWKKKYIESTNKINTLTSCQLEILAKLKEKDAELAEATSHLETLQNELTVKDAKLSEISSANETALKEMLDGSAVLREKLNTAKEERRQIEEKFVILKTQHDQLSKLLGERDDKLKAMEDEKKVCESKIERLLEDVEGLRHKNLSLEIMNEVHQQLLDKMHLAELKVDEQQQRIITLECQVTVLEEKEGQITAEKAEVENGLMEKENKYKTELETMMHNFELLEKQLDDQTKMIFELGETVKFLEGESENAWESARSQSHMIEEHLASVNEAREALSKMEQEKEEVKVRFDAMQEKHSLLEASYKDALARLKDANFRLTEVSSHSKENEEETTTLLCEVENLRIKISDLESGCRKHSEVIRELENRNDDLVSQREKLNGELENLHHNDGGLEEGLKAKELQLSDLEKANAEIREEFDAAIEELRGACSTLRSEIDAKDLRIAHLMSDNAGLVLKGRQSEDNLTKEKEHTRELELQFGCYKEVSQLMQREISYEKSQIVDENEASQLRVTVTNLGKQLLALQKKNVELSSSKINDGVVTGLKKEVEDKENEIIEMGEKMQDLFADKEMLEKEKESLKDRLQKEEECKKNSIDLLSTIELLQKDNTDLKSKLLNFEEKQEQIMKKMEDLLHLHQVEHKNNIISMESKFMYMEGLFTEISNEKDNVNARLMEAVGNNEQLTDRILDLELRQEETILLIEEKNKKIESLLTEIESLESGKSTVISENDNLKCENQKLLEENEALKCDYERMQLKYDQLTSKTNCDTKELNEKLSANEELINNVKKENERISEDRRNLHERNENLTERSHCLENDLNSVRSELENLNSKHSSLTEEKVSLTQMLTEKESQIELLSQTIRDGEETIRGLLSEKAIRISKLDELDNQIKCLEQDKAEFSALIDKTERVLNENASQYIQEYNGLKMQLQHTIDQREKEITDLKLQLQESEKKVEELNAQVVELEDQIQNLSEQLKTEKLKYDDKFSQMEELERAVKASKEDLVGLKAKFSLTQCNLSKKDKEIETSQKLNNKFKENVDKLKVKVKELQLSEKDGRGKLEQLTDELGTLRNSLRDKERELLHQTDLSKSAFSKLSEVEKSNANLKEKMSHLQNQNKKMQTELSKFVKKLNLSKEPEVEEMGDDIVPSSQQSDFESGRSRTFEHLRSRRSSAARTSRDKATSIGADTAPYQSLVATPPRRVTRLSASRSRTGFGSSSESEKRSSSQDFSQVKRLKLMDSNLEGLPFKANKGLNDIPEGLESPGVIRRSTTPLKNAPTAIPMSSRGPLCCDDNLGEICRENPPEASCPQKEEPTFVEFRNPCPLLSKSKNSLKRSGRKQPYSESEKDCKTQ